MVSPQMITELARDFMRLKPRQPVKLPEYAVVATGDTPALPDPVLWRWCVVAVLDKGCVAVSNGTAWVRADGTAL